MNSIDSDLIKKSLEANKAIKTETNLSEKVNTIQHVCHTNVVSGDRLKEIQLETLKTLKDHLSKTYGPMGSYTAIIKGSSADNIFANYSKDGLKVLKNIIFDSPIEMALQTELVDICKYVESKVGDGTTSAVVLSSLIFEGLRNVFNNKSIPPRKIVKEFCDIVNVLQELITMNRRDITLDDIYDICMISTNGNEQVSTQIVSLYKEYGFNVNIDVTISNDQNTKIKTYDGLTINEGYSDPAYINREEGDVCEIRNAHVYSFQDPVDTPEMISYFERIIYDNIFTPANNDENPVPTVIICPMISRDGLGLLNKLIEIMYTYNAKKMVTQKPPILILTNIHGVDEEIASDITRLCGCRQIRKFINAEVQEKEQKAGNAPTLDTVHEFSGFCELVSADLEKTKFINPKDITDNNSEAYNSLVSFLRTEIQNAINMNEDSAYIGRIKKRLRCLEANMIEFLVGGISISDRDSLKDLVEDAVKNCASASEYGVGRAANFEGLLASYSVLKDLDNSDTIGRSIANVIFNAYYEAARILYSTAVEDGNKVDNFVIKSLENGCPFNVSDLFYHGDFASKGTNVLCSIRTDIEILDAISKIITMMVTSNQCLLQSPSVNRY